MSADSEASSLPIVASTFLQNGMKTPHNVAVGLKGLLSVCMQSSSGRPRQDRQITCRPTDGQSAFTFFRMRRRMECADKGDKIITNKAALEEWTALPPEEREHFEREAKERRKNANAQAFVASGGAEAEECGQALVASCGANGSMLQKLREQSDRQAQVTAKLPPSTKPLDETSDTPKVKRQRKKDPVEEIERPVFPQRRDTAPSCVDKMGRRQEIVGAIRANTQSISVSSNHDVSLLEISARLDGPTLSCDWQRRASSDNESDDDRRLEVDMPAGTSARELMDDEVRRKISSAQVRLLIK